MKKILLCLSILLTIFNVDNVAYVCYVSANLNMRYGPGVGYEIITTLPKGTPVTIEEDCDCKWVPIEYRGFIGYISTKYLSNKAPQKELKRERQLLTYQHITYLSPRSGVRHYTNTDGYRVQSPTYYSSVPVGATALCRDGTYSFSRNRRGTCSRHGCIKMVINYKKLNQI